MVRVWPELTAESVKEAVNYDPETGIFSLIKRPHSKKHGKVMGCLRDDGYLGIRVRYRLYLCHRLAWFYVYGAWSINLDHINGDRADNRIANLREATQSQNISNSAIVWKNSSVRKGVCWDKSRNLFRAYIVLNKKQKQVGRFKTVEEAIAARIEAEAKYHGEFARAA